MFNDQCPSCKEHILKSVKWLAKGGEGGWGGGGQESPACVSLPLSFHIQVSSWIDKKADPGPAARLVGRAEGH